MEVFYLKAAKAERSSPALPSTSPPSNGHPSRARRRTRRRTAPPAPRRSGGCASYSNVPSPPPMPIFDPRIRTGLPLPRAASRLPVRSGLRQAPGSVLSRTRAPASDVLWAFLCRVPLAVGSSLFPHDHVEDTHLGPENHRSAAGLSPHGSAATDTSPSRGVRMSPHMTLAVASWLR